jgi:hypothetical protein
MTRGSLPRVDAGDASDGTFSINITQCEKMNGENLVGILVTLAGCARRICPF